jgi:hypothetical protein
MNSLFGELPDWIEPDAWNDYMAMRKRIKKPMSDRRMKQFIARCYELHKAGHDVNQSLDEASDHGWLDLYEPKDKSIRVKTSAENGFLAQPVRQRDPHAQDHLKAIKDKLRRVA